VITRTLLLVVCCASIVGCVSARETMLTKQHLPELRREDVQVYLTEADIKQPYDKVALIHLSGDSGWTDEQGMYDAAKKKAAQIGANGIVLSEIHEPSAGSKVAGAIFGVPVDRKSQVLAVLVK
jgi:hypothetical protein